MDVVPCSRLPNILSATNETLQGTYSPGTYSPVSKMKLPDIPPASVDEKESLFISRNIAGREEWQGFLSVSLLCLCCGL